VLRGIQHCALVVSDLERSRRFYGEVLGLEEVPRPSSFAFAGAWFRAGADEIHLIAAADTTSPPGGHEPGRSLQAGLATHLAFEVDDLAGMRERLAGHGVEPASGPMPRGDGVVQFFVRDPDGFVVEFFERTGEDQSAAPARAAVRA
jgi:catechol 2,3-dioxygenase-like lactoylglutathione lyase family enzyme